MKTVLWMALALSVSIRLAAQVDTSSGRWEKPSAALAEQISAILGPGQAQLSFKNLSSIEGDQIPFIRKLIEQDLKIRGVVVSGTESANAVRISFSESDREFVWVAEIAQGSETQVTMTRMSRQGSKPLSTSGLIVLRKQVLLTSREQILAAVQNPEGMIALEPTQIVVYSQTPQGLRESQRVSLLQDRPLARDARGILVTSSDGMHFQAEVPGVSCSGSRDAAAGSGVWNINCHSGDDPWPLLVAGAADVSGTLSAFYNPARNYFTGVLSPAAGVDLPPFYSLTTVPRATGAALLVGGIDGKVVFAENGSVHSASGTRDWGSDFAEMRSGCGIGAQIIAAGSGQASNDSVRAYEFPASEAIPASAPLSVEGTVTALWSAPDGRSVLDVVHSQSGQYEVDRVTALCN